MSKQRSFLLHKILRFTLNLMLHLTGKLKVFLSLLPLLGPFFSCVLLVKHEWFLENNFADNSNDNATSVA